MPYPVKFDSQYRIFIIDIYRAVSRYDAILVNHAIKDSNEPADSPTLLDFRPMKTGVVDVFEWTLFIGQIRSTQDQRLALLSSAVGHATSCHIIALLSNGEHQNVQAFQDESVARRWLSDSSNLRK